MKTRWLPGMLLLVLTIAVMGIAPEARAFQVRDGKKILIFGARQAVPNLDPHVKTDWSTRTIQQSVYDALLKYGWWNESLAEKWLNEADFVLAEQKNLGKNDWLRAAGRLDNFELVTRTSPQTCQDTSALWLYRRK